VARHLELHHLLKVLLPNFFKPDIATVLALLAQFMATETYNLTVKGMKTLLAIIIIQE
jgi:hypothetical protein